jgi:hypothetical protein
MFILFQVRWKLKEETISSIKQHFQQVEKGMTQIPEFLLRIDNLKREWILIRSLLTVGISMKLEQYQIIHQQIEKRQLTSLDQTFLESANRLFKEIIDVKEKIEKFDAKFSAVLRGDLEKSEHDDMAYLKEKEMKFLESFNGWKRQLQQQSEKEDVNMD